MAKKQVLTKEEQELTETYFYAVGRRKTAVVQARLYPVIGQDITTETDVVSNGREGKEYFMTQRWWGTVVAPLKAVGLAHKFRVSLVSKGGGISAQADAAKLAVARALQKYDVALRPLLKAEGFFTRDAREVERKKPGLKKARKSPQWAKR
jgi:small subunit ribosomal protein S9